MFTASRRGRGHGPLLAGALLLVAVACADVDRTVTEHRIETDPEGSRTWLLGWESNVYPRIEVEVDAICWNRAGVGQPLPEFCLTTRILANETQPLRRSLLLGAAAVAIAVYLLVETARRRISWPPVVDRVTAGDPPVPHFSTLAATRLARAATREQFEATHPPRRPRRYRLMSFLAGLLVPVLVLPPAVLLAGYGTALGWALVTGAVLLLGVWLAAIALVTPLPLPPVRTEPHLARFAFLGGAALGLLVVAAIGLIQRTPLLELNGIVLLG
jgi:hypothetical protein